MKLSSDSHHGRDTLNQWYIISNLFFSLPSGLCRFSGNFVTVFGEGQHSLHIGYIAVNCACKVDERKYVEKTEEKRGSRL